MQELISTISSVELAQPWWLLLLLLLPVFWWLERRRVRGRKGMMFPGVSRLKAEGMAAGRWVRLPQWLMRSAIVLAVVATGRPQITRAVTEASEKGIDIVFALDISESMLEEDFEGSRLDAAKKIALRFIRVRQIVCQGNPGKQPESIIKDWKPRSYEGFHRCPGRGESV